VINNGFWEGHVILEEKKGEDILLLDLIGICSFTDYFVICTGSSDRSIKALADEVLKTTRKAKSAKAQGIEGDASSGWVLIDFGDVILHLFSKSIRHYYQLEDLWREGRVIVRLQ
jgi:ribosome-associated protein